MNEGRFKVWQISWPNGLTYIGVRTRETEGTWRSSLRLGATRERADALSRAARDHGVDKATIEVVRTYETEAPALADANARIATVPKDKRTNARRLVPLRRPRTRQ